jgi:hypothetical protein
MYSLTIQHDLQTIHIKWDLEPLDPDDDYNIIFTNFFLLVITLTIISAAALIKIDNFRILIIGKY